MQSAKGARTHLVSLPAVHDEQARAGLASIRNRIWPLAPDLGPERVLEQALGSCVPPQCSIPAPGPSFPTNHSMFKLKLEKFILEHGLFFFLSGHPFRLQGVNEVLQRQHGGAVNAADPPNGSNA